MGDLGCSEVQGFATLLQALLGSQQDYCSEELSTQD